MLSNYKIINKKKLAIVIFVDILGFLLIKPFVFLRRKKNIKKEEIKKILIIRTAYVGDVVMTTPVLEPLREMFPNAKIFFLTGNREAEILKNNSSIDEIFLYDAFWFYPGRIGKVVNNYLKLMRKVRREQFDLAIDFRGDIRDILFLLFLSHAYHRVSYGVGGGSYLLTEVVPFKKIKHKIFYHLDILKFLGAENIESNKPQIYLSAAEDEFQKTVFKINNISENDLVVGIHPGGRKKLKCWHLEGYVEIINRLIRNLGAKIVITGSIAEIDLAREIKSAVPETISLCGKTRLRQLSSLIKGFNLFICGDCAPMHIACTLGTPVIAIFGPSKSGETGPYGNFRLIEKDFPCRISCDENVCHHRPHHECMKTISPEDVYNAAVDLIKKK